MNRSSEGIGIADIAMGPRLSCLAPIEAAIEQMNATTALAEASMRNSSVTIGSRTIDAAFFGDGEFATSFGTQTSRQTATAGPSVRIPCPYESFVEPMTAAVLAITDGNLARAVAFSDGQLDFPSSEFALSVPVEADQVTVDVDGNLSSVEPSARISDVQKRRTQMGR